MEHLDNMDEAVKAYAKGVEVAKHHVTGKNMLKVLEESLARTEQMVHERDIKTTQAIERKR
jgi:hypothetical protein